ELFKTVMRSSTELMYRARQVSNLGGFMSGVNNNGAHSANGITAMFIATGQDAANVAESSAAFVYAELRPNGDYYYSVTIPARIPERDEVLPERRLGTHVVARQLDLPSAVALARSEQHRGEQVLLGEPLAGPRCRIVLGQEHVVYPDEHAWCQLRPDLEEEHR